ncbi:putative expression site associated gene (ESAG) 4 protein, partial [Trypanosoma grayi]|uniref:putative expression site associated gene (ESAG) 4 protein n=1 Tax=Trypanosoma grayi TaxID=71804 RepID=UPI0004F44D02
LRGFATVRLMRSVAARMDKVGASLLADFFYTNIILAVDDMQYGMFDDSGCVVYTSEESCHINYGAKHISVWSMSHVLDPAEPQLLLHVTPSMQYSRLTLSESTFTMPDIIGICIAGGSLLCTAAVLIAVLYCHNGSRDNNNAPKEPTDPVTLVFTDIENSTALWA